MVEGKSYFSTIWALFLSTSRPEGPTNPSSGQKFSLHCIWPSLTCFGLWSWLPPPNSPETLENFKVTQKWPKSDFPGFPSKWPKSDLKSENPLWGEPRKVPFFSHFSGCRKRSAAKGVRSLSFVFGTLSVTFRSLFLMLLSLFFVTFFAKLLLPESFCGRVIGIIERGVPQAYVRAHASSETLRSVHVSRVFLCIFYIKMGNWYVSKRAWIHVWYVSKPVPPCDGTPLMITLRWTFEWL